MDFVNIHKKRKPRVILRPSLIFSTALYFICYSRKIKVFYFRPKNNNDVTDGI